MLLSVANLGKAYDGRTVLRDASFELERGAKALLLGPSGSGKSTLLNLICGLQTPDNGRVTVDGETIAAPEGAPAADSVRRRTMGIVFQTLRLVSALSIRANLELAQRLQVRRVDRPTIDATLERLGIAHRAHARPFELSQGEAQRAAIARAVVLKPRLLVADEPTSALDHANTEAVARLLVDAAESVDAALLVATHDDRLTPYLDRTLTIADGMVTEC